MPMVVSSKQLYISHNYLPLLQSVYPYMAVIPPFLLFLSYEKPLGENHVAHPGLFDVQPRE